MPIRPYLRPDGRSPNYYARGYVWVWRDGRPSKYVIPEQSTRTADEREAEAICKQLEQRYQRENVEGRRAAKTFAEAMIAYTEAGGDARFLAKPLDAFYDAPIDQISQDDIDKEGRKAYPKASSATMRRQWHTPIAAVLRHAGIEKRVRRPKDGRARTVWVRPRDAAEIVSRAARGRFKHPWAGPLVELFFGGGLRLSEAIMLDARDDVFTDFGYVVVRNPKNGHERVVRLPRRTTAALAGLPNLGEPGPLFRSYHGEPYVAWEGTGTRVGFIKTAVRDAGLDPKIFTPHTFRHSWATWRYSQTKDLIDLRANGGWRTVTQCERYTHLASPEIAEEAIRLGWDFRESNRESPAVPLPRGARS